MINGKEFGWFFQSDFKIEYRNLNIVMLGFSTVMLSLLKQI
jgi:hypothetical protein